MTTADIALGFSEFGWWLFGFEEWVKDASRSVADWVVDRIRWVRSEVARRRHYPVGRHGDQDAGISVWEYLHRIPLEELKYQWRPRGQHRTKGWRYASAVWPVLERIADHREWSAWMDGEIRRMMDEIHYMLGHPPLPAEFTVHGCQDCLCGQVKALRQEALA